MKDHLAETALELGWNLDPSLKRLSGSNSGAGVFRTQTLAGNDAVVKITVNGPLRQAARRELDFYLSLADQVPVMTPTLHRHVDSDHCIALLISAHGTTPPARQWQPEAWVRLAEDLVDLHTTPIWDPVPWTSSSWLIEALTARPTDWLQRFWSGTAAASEAAYLITQRAEFLDAITSLPHGLIHGDCHVDNLLLDGDRFVWSDWQATTIGNPANDMAFLWMRANSDGANVPYSPMVEAYLARMGTRTYSNDAFRRSLIAIEIGIVIFGWPTFANLHPQDEQNRVVSRLIDLAEQWRR